MNAYRCFVVVLLCHVGLTQSKDESGEYKKFYETKSPKNSQMHDYQKHAHTRPTKCQVCRVLMQELWSAVNETNGIKESLWLTNRLDGEEKRDEKRGKKIVYKKSEMRLMDILEDICKKVYDYRSIAGPEFPYLKGVKSMFRQQLEEAMGTSGLKLTLDAPEAMIEDPTFELKRMHFECNQMIEEHEEDIVEWYMNVQETNPLLYLCAERIINENDQDCLTASTTIPDWARTPSQKKKGEKEIKLTTGNKMEL